MVFALIFSVYWQLSEWKHPHPTPTLPKRVRGLKHMFRVLRFPWRLMTFEIIKQTWPSSQSAIRSANMQWTLRPDLNLTEHVLTHTCGCSKSVQQFQNIQETFLRLLYLKLYWTDLAITWHENLHAFLRACHFSCLLTCRSGEREEESSREY